MILRKEFPYYVNKCESNDDPPNFDLGGWNQFPQLYDDDYNFFSN